MPLAQLLMVVLVVEIDRDAGGPRQSREHLVDSHVDAFKRRWEVSLARGRVVRIGVAACEADRATFREEVRAGKEVFHSGEEVQRRLVDGLEAVGHGRGAEGNPVQVVGQRDAVALGHIQDFVLAVGEEGRPLDGGGGSGGPVEDGLPACVSYGQLSAFVDARKTDDERAHLLV